MSDKVLVVTNDFPPRRGGIESFASSLCAGLPSDELVVYTASMPGDAAQDASLDYAVIRDPAGCLLPTRRVARAVRDVVRRHGCDRVVFGAAAPLGLLAGGLRDGGVRRIVALTHGHEVWWARTPVTRSLLRRIGDEVDVLTYVSEYCRREIAASLSASAARRMLRLSPGVSIERFAAAGGGAEVRRAAGIDPGRPVVLAAARLVARKGHDTLVHAWPRVMRGVPDAALLVVGDGPHEAALRASISRLRLEKSVFMQRGVPWEQMPSVYDAADVFALPCRSRLAGLEVEALGIVFLEAAAAGLPVVVGASGGAPETVDDRHTGYVVDPRDLSAVAERVVLLLSDPSRAAQMGLAGRARVAAHWSDDHAVRKLRAALSGLASLAEAAAERSGGGSSVDTCSVLGAPVPSVDLIEETFIVHSRARVRAAVKADLEGDRAAGVPRVPLAQRVVVSPPTDSPTDEAQGAMADQTTSSISIAADPAAVMAVIADFDSYPAWAKGVKSANVLSSRADGRAREVAFVLEAAPIKDEYTLRYDWDDDTQVSWSLVEATMLKEMRGAYVLSADGDVTDVTYQLAVDLNIPMIGMLKRKGEKVIIDTALKGLKARVESYA